MIDLIHTYVLDVLSESSTLYDMVSCVYLKATLARSLTYSAVVVLQYFGFELELEKGY